MRVSKMHASCATLFLLAARSSIASIAGIASRATPTWTCGYEGGQSKPPCPLPPWPATWQMNASTIIMPCNYTGYQDPSTTAGWGVVDFDWSNNLAGWSAATPMDNDERQLHQVKLIKTSPHTASYTKVFIYRNSVYGYPWFTSVRKILDDPAYAPWFMKFAGKGPWSSPNCDLNYDPPKCTTYFHTQMDTPLPTAHFGPEGRPIGGYVIYTRQVYTVFNIYTFTKSTCVEVDANETGTSISLSLPVLFLFLPLPLSLTLTLTLSRKVRRVLPEG